MPRRGRPRPPGPGPVAPGVGGWVRTETGADGDDWVVRSVSGSAATKPYRCPGCDQSIPPGTPHVVAWPAEGASDEYADRGSPERRHWHTGCWRRGR